MRLQRFTSVLIMAGLMSWAAVTEAQVTWNSVTLSWTTPGDDSLTGNASQFDLRYATSPITTDNFGSATRWTGMPSPSAPGSRQSATVTGLSSNTTYYFAIKTSDEVPNWSGLSNLISRTTQIAPDTERPAPLAVSISAITDSTASLSWVAVGDDSLSGAASSYDVRFSTSLITAANWSAATQAAGEPAPATAGTSQSFVVRGLARQVVYYFAIRVADESGNLSALSNVPSATTPDTMAPAAIVDLSSGFVWFGWHSGRAARSRSEAGGL